MSRKIVSLGAIVLAMSASAVSAQPPQSAEFWRGAHLSIGADGKVTALTFVNANAKDDKVDQRLEPLIRSWTFAPGTVDGQPMATETTLQLRLEMSKTTDDNYSIKLLGADTGPGQLTNTPPDYPGHEITAGAEAKVTLLLSIDATGAPVDISAASVITSGSGMSKASFTRAAIDAAKHWRFQPETVGGHPVASHIRVPVTFCLGASNQCLSIAKQVAAEGKATPANIPVALDSKAKLLTQVAGTTF